METQERERELVYAKRTCTGVHGEGINKHGSEYSLTTYAREFEPDILARLVDGCVCVDLMPIDGADHFVKAVFRAPMVRAKSFRKFDFADVSPVFASAMAVGGNEFGALLAGAAVGAICLDDCTPEQGGEYWASQGARVGRYNLASNSIEWKEN